MWTKASDSLGSKLSRNMIKLHYRKLSRNNKWIWITNDPTSKKFQEQDNPLKWSNF